MLRINKSCQFLNLLKMWLAETSCILVILNDLQLHTQVYLQKLPLNEISPINFHTLVVFPCLKIWGLNGLRETRTKPGRYRAGVFNFLSTLDLEASSTAVSPVELVLRFRVEFEWYKHVGHVPLQWLNKDVWVIAQHPPLPMAWVCQWERGQTSENGGTLTDQFCFLLQSVPPVRCDVWRLTCRKWWNLTGDKQGKHNLFHIVLIKPCGHLYAVRHAFGKEVK